MESSSNQNQPNRVYLLREVTGLVNQALLGLSRDEFWVQAHLIPDRGSQRSGHYYCELMDVDDAGKQIAKMRAVIWQGVYSKILNKLADAGTPDVLKENSEICVLCSVRFSDLYGLSLNIFDIDPTFGENQISRNRRQILEKLSKEKILEKNKEAYLTAAPLRIGLVTSKESAAYNDFVNTLSSAPFAFRIILADCSMQGENTECDVLSSLDLLVQSGVDVICIVRGGGSQSDLAWFDNESIARAVTSCPLPVWVGIGHEIDFGVLDAIAHSRFKTPTAVAEALVNRLRGLLNRLEFAGNRLQTIVERQMALSKEDLQRKNQGALMGFRKQFDSASQLFDNRILATRSSFNECFNNEEKSLALKTQRVGDRCTWFVGSNIKNFAEKWDRIQLPRYMQILTDKETNLIGKEKHLNSILPEQVLKRGYTITRNSRGDILKSIKHIQENEIIETQFADGTAKSIVREREVELEA